MAGRYLGMVSLRTVNVVLVLAFGVAFSLGHMQVATRALGLSVLVCSAEWMRRRSMPVVAEGRYPFTHATGAWAIVSGLGLLTLGINLLVFSEPTACMLGWDNGELCGR